MTADLRACLTFHLTGRRAGTDLAPIDSLDLRPALLASYRDLSALRYDFPVVLTRDTDTGFVHSLSGLIDGLLHDSASGDDAARVAKHLLRLEQQMRALVAQGETGVLSDLWATAASRLGVRGDDKLRDSLDRAQAVLGIDGEVADCDRALPSRLIAHVWNTAQQQKARRFHEKVNGLILRLSDLLRSDIAHSHEGRSPHRLKASVGSPHQDAFDFDAMSRILATTERSSGPREDRRNRIRALIATLESQRFFPALDDVSAGPGEPYGFIFESCGAALMAYRERRTSVIEILRAIALAELEIVGTASDTSRLAVTEGFDADQFSRLDLALFPDYLVLMNTDDMEPIEQATLIDILAAGLPIKVLLQTDDLLGDSTGGVTGLGVHARQLATMALGLTDVYVLQACASHLVQFRQQIVRGITCTGPALFSVFSGASGASSDLPPYLLAAAAMESRAFPAFVYDPGGGPDWASRFDVRGNPQPDLDWPVRHLAYEDEAHQRISEDVAFTTVDFLACDRRNDRHLAGAPRDAKTADLVSITTWLAAPTATMPTSIPAVLMADRENKLHRVVVDGTLMRDARRCLEMWHSLQELGGIHNSHPQRLLGLERQARHEAAPREPDNRQDHASETTATSESRPQAAAPSVTSAAAVAAVVASQDQARSPDEPYIETPRCSTCNECIQINGRMFAYNGNKQAYIADPSAGTYRQLVEAAESCQVSVIHPGKPRDPSEPGLEELLVRAGPFL